VTLLSIPINNPFPVTLALSAAAIAIFGIELAVAKLHIHPQNRMYFFMVSCLALGVILAVWSGYYALQGPSAAEPIIHGSGAHNTYYDFYANVWAANVAIFLVMSILVLVIGIALTRQRRQRG
jgi:uncharacterized membrane protein YqjE